MIVSTVNHSELSSSEVAHLSSFIQDFYRVTDKGTSDEYGLQYLTDATLILNHTQVQGREAIMDFHKGIRSRNPQTHVVEKVIFVKEPPVEVDGKEHIKVEGIIQGTVALVSATGEVSDLGFLARGEYVSLDGTDWKIQRYRVYLNSQPLSKLRL